MAHNVPDSAELIVLRLITGLKTSGGNKLRLFKNDVQPSTVTALSGLTQADYPGYAAKGPADLWDTYATDVNGKGRIRTKELTFTRGAGAGASQTIYGYYITIIIDTVEQLLDVVRFPSPKVLAAEGDSFPLTADFLASSDPLP